MRGPSVPVKKKADIEYKQHKQDKDIQRVRNDQRPDKLDTDQGKQHAPDCESETEPPLRHEDTTFLVNWKSINHFRIHGLYLNRTWKNRLKKVTLKKFMNRTNLVMLITVKILTPPFNTGIICYILNGNNLEGEQQAALPFQRAEPLAERLRRKQLLKSPRSCLTEAFTLGQAGRIRYLLRVPHNITLCGIKVVPRKPNLSSFSAEGFFTTSESTRFSSYVYPSLKWRLSPCLIRPRINPP